jgi:hypothetical protein
MLRAARAALALRQYDIHLVGDDDQPMVLRLFWKTINSADAAAHGLTRAMVLNEASQQRHRPSPLIRQAEKLAGTLGGVRSDLTAYTPEAVADARLWREERKQLDELLADRDPELVAQARAVLDADPGDTDPDIADGLRNLVEKDELLSSMAPDAALLRLLDKEEKVEADKEAVERKILAEEQRRYVGMARKLGSAGISRSMEQREAMICAAVVKGQTLVMAQDSPPEAPEWIPDPRDPAAHEIAIDRTIDGPIVGEPGQPVRYPIRLLSVDQINRFSEVIFMESMGGAAGAEALRRFRGRSAGAAGPVPDRDEAAEVRRGGA